jgi:hypothetical protein
MDPKSQKIVANGNGLDQQQAGGDVAPEQKVQDKITESGVESETQMDAIAKMISNFTATMESRLSNVEAKIAPLQGFQISALIPKSSDQTLREPTISKSVEPEVVRPSIASDHSLLFSKLASILSPVRSVNAIPFQWDIGTSLDGTLVYWMCKEERPSPFSNLYEYYLSQLTDALSLYRKMKCLLIEPEKTVEELGRRVKYTVWNDALESMMEKKLPGPLFSLIRNMQANRPGDTPSDRQADFRVINNVNVYAAYSVGRIYTDPDLMDLFREMSEISRGSIIWADAFNVIADTVRAFVEGRTTGVMPIRGVKILTSYAVMPTSFFGEAPLNMIGIMTSTVVNGIINPDGAIRHQFLARWCVNSSRAVSIIPPTVTSIDAIQTDIVAALGFNLNDLTLWSSVPLKMSVNDGTEFFNMLMTVMRCNSFVRISVPEVNAAGLVDWISTMDYLFLIAIAPAQAFTARSIQTMRNVIFSTIMYTVAGNAPQGWVPLLDQANADAIELNAIRNNGNLVDRVFNMFAAWLRVDRREDWPINQRRFTFSALRCFTWGGEQPYVRHGEGDNRSTVTRRVFELFQAIAATPPGAFLRIKGAQRNVRGLINYALYCSEKAPDAENLGWWATEMHKLQMSNPFRFPTELADVPDILLVHQYMYKRGSASSLQFTHLIDPAKPLLYESSFGPFLKVLALNETLQKLSSVFYFVRGLGDIYPGIPEIYTSRKVAMRIATEFVAPEFAELGESDLLTHFVDPLNVKKIQLPQADGNTNFEREVVAVHNYLQRSMARAGIAQVAYYSTTGRRFRKGHPGNYRQGPIASWVSFSERELPEGVQLVEYNYHDLVTFKNERSYARRFDPEVVGDIIIKFNFPFKFKVQRFTQEPIEQPEVSVLLAEDDSLPSFGVIHQYFMLPEDTYHVDSRIVNKPIHWAVNWFDVDGPLRIVPFDLFMDQQMHAITYLSKESEQVSLDDIIKIYPKTMSPI